VFDREAPSSKRARAELEKRDVREQIHKYAAWRSRSPNDAGDIVSDALVRVLDPAGKPWDPAKRTFYRHMRFAIDDIVVERARGGRARFEIVDGGPGEAALFEGARADDELQDHREIAWLRHLGQRLLAQLGGRDDLAERVFHLAATGIEEPADQAQELGCSVDAIYEATRRLKYHGARAKAEEEAADADRMKSVRERARKAERT
jgi:DNA-directed RNA polymerase specialized sigma24 family protein